jgi:hypothetical protein
MHLGIDDTVAKKEIFCLWKVFQCSLGNLEGRCMLLRKIALQLTAALTSIAMSPLFAKDWGVFAERIHGIEDPNKGLSCWVCASGEEGSAACLGTDLQPDTLWPERLMAVGAGCVLLRRGTCAIAQNFNCAEATPKSSKYRNRSDKVLAKTLDSAVQAGARAHAAKALLDIANSSTELRPLSSARSSVKTLTANESGLCDGILQFGIRDVSENYSKKERFSLTQAAICNESFNSSAKAKSSGGTFGIDIPGVLGLDASGNYDETTYQKAWSKFCASSYDEASSNDQQFTHVSQASAVIANAWSTCIANQAKTFISYVEPSEDRTRFSVYLENRLGTGDLTFTITKFAMAPSGRAQCHGITLADPFTPVKVSLNYSSFVCEKPGDQEITLVLETDRGAVRPMTIPARKEVPISLQGRLDQIESKLRSVIIENSVMTFAGTYKEAEQLTSIGWWICDGRTINDAASKLNGLATPNLSNKFLMGSQTSGATGGNSSVALPDQTITSFASDFGPGQIHQDPSRLRKYTTCADPLLT